jgi:hypothetical protein
MSGTNLSFFRFRVLVLARLLFGPCGIKRIFGRSLALLAWVAAVFCSQALLPEAAFANEVMTDRCSGDVAFPRTYDGFLDGAFILTRGPGQQSNWSFPISQTLDGDGHIRWWCHSTTGNWLDPGTYTFSGGATYACGDSNGSQNCTIIPDLPSGNPVDATGWTAERSRCSDHSNVFRAVLGPDRLLQIECLGETTGSVSHPLIGPPPSSPGGVAGADVRYAAIWVKDSSIPWVAFHGMTAATFQYEFNTQGANGYRLVSVSSYEADGQPLYAAVWDKVPSPAWVARNGLSAPDYQQAFNLYAAQGFHLVWINGSTVDGADRYAAIWENSPTAAWVAHHGMSAADFQTDFNQLVSQGYRLRQVSGYAIGNQDRYAAIWDKSPGPAWIARNGMTADVYQQQFNAQAAAGYRLAHISGYRVNGQILFAAIWDKAPTPPWVARHNMSPADYQAAINQMSAQGYRLVEVSGY